MSAEKVRIGVIGVGQIGKHHLNNYAKIADAEIVAVPDINTAEAEREKRATIFSSAARAGRSTLMATVLSINTCVPR